MATDGSDPGGRRPRLQIGLPVYNGANFLAEALDSLLAQTFTDFEILVSDNGSTDETQQIAEKYVELDDRVRYFRYDTNRGAAWNFNNCVHLADAPLFKWAAHDDLHTPEFVERCIEVLDREPDVILVCTGSTSIDGDGNPNGDYRRENCHLRETSPATRFSRTLGLYPMHVVFGVARRAALARTRLWGTVAASDRVVVSEIALHGQIYEIDEPLFIRRWHENVSWTIDTTDQEYALWYDPKNKDKRFSVPKLARGLSYAKAIHAADLPRTEAVKAYGHLARYALWTQGLCSVGRNVGALLPKR